MGGDLLFDPHTGKTWDRDEDHLAMIIELVGPFPRKMMTSGKYAGEYFTRKGELKHIHHLKYWSLLDVLKDKYKFGDEAREIAEFLTPLLCIDPERRASAADCLKHPFLAPDPLDSVENGTHAYAYAEARADAKVAETSTHVGGSESKGGASLMYPRAEEKEAHFDY